MPTARTTRRALVAVVAVCAVAGGWMVVRHRRGASPLPGLSRDARAPDGVRITVEVLNGTRVRGLARRATLQLRDRGFDVVDLGNADSVRDSTLVLDRSGHPEWARLVSDALGGARVESRPDSTRYLDVTVLLGSTWRPSSQPFYP